MSFVDSLLPVLMNMLYIGIALVTIRYMYMGYFFIIRKNELVYLRSQISALKLKLRGRLAQKLNATQASGVSELKTSVNKIFDEIRTLEFVQSSDYQMLINKIMEINEAYELHNILHKNKDVEVAPAADNSIAPEFDMIRQKCEAVFEFDPDLVSIVIDIAKFTDEFIKRAHDYNHYTVHEKSIPQIKDIPEKIQIEHFFIYEDLYKQHKAVLEMKLAQARALAGTGLNDKSAPATSATNEITPVAGSDHNKSNYKKGA